MEPIIVLRAPKKVSEVVLDASPNDDHATAIAISMAREAFKNKEYVYVATVNVPDDLQLNEALNEATLVDPSYNVSYGDALVYKGIAYTSYIYDWVSLE